MNYPPHIQACIERREQIEEILREGKLDPTEIIALRAERTNPLYLLHL